MDPLASEYISSMEADSRIFYSVVQINLAHTIMLAERRIIEGSDAAAILQALYKLHEHGVSGLDLRPELEDIYMAVEDFVTKATSEEVGSKFNTAKSRNDQVATAIRLTLRKNLLDVEEKLLELVNALIALSEKNTDTIMPGYTHHLRASPRRSYFCLPPRCRAHRAGLRCHELLSDGSLRASWDELPHRSRAGGAHVGF